MNRFTAVGYKLTDGEGRSVQRRRGYASPEQTFEPGKTVQGDVVAEGGPGSLGFSVSLEDAVRMGVFHARSGHHDPLITKGFKVYEVRSDQTTSLGFTRKEFPGLPASNESLMTGELNAPSLEVLSQVSTEQLLQVMRSSNDAVVVRFLAAALPPTLVAGVHAVLQGSVEKGLAINPAFGDRLKVGDPVRLRQDADRGHLPSSVQEVFQSGSVTVKSLESKNVDTVLVTLENERGQRTTLSSDWVDHPGSDRLEWLRQVNGRNLDEAGGDYVAAVRPVVEQMERGEEATLEFVRSMRQSADKGNQEAAKFLRVLDSLAILRELDSRD
ncbi:MAG: hypothetical protein AB1758_01200 [Candidatus Eremiobacterota bacterium]